MAQPTKPSAAQSADHKTDCDVDENHDHVGTLSTASVTVLRAGSAVDGTPTIAAAGLCGSLRVWMRRQQRTKVSLKMQPAAGNDVEITVNCALRLSGAWDEALHVSSLVRLNRGRTSSHPFRFVTRFMGHHFAAASAEPDSAIHVYCARESSVVTEVQALHPSGDCHSERWSTSCLEMSSTHLAAGSREGGIAVWPWDARTTQPVELSGLEPCWRTRADEGPVAALTIHAASDVLVAAYRQGGASSVDGAPFCGEQSVAAWHLHTGALLWIRTHADASLPPTLGLLLAGVPSSQPSQSNDPCPFWLLHAHTADADADWPWLARGDEATRCVMDSAAATMRGDRRDLLPSSRVLCWDFADGRWVDGRSEVAEADSAQAASAQAASAQADSAQAAIAAVGCADGRVALVTLSALSGRARYLWGGGVGGAETGAVVLLPRQRHTAPRVLSGSAAALLTLWGKNDARKALIPLHCVRMPLQPCSLALLDDDAANTCTVACGGADGSVTCCAWPSLGAAASPGGPVERAVERAVEGSVEDATVAAQPTTALSWVDSQAQTYDWRFATGPNGSAGGRVAERREVFDGWARTASFERGLRDMLLGRSSGKPGDGSSARYQVSGTASGSRGRGGGGGGGVRAGSGRRGGGAAGSSGVTAGAPRSGVRLPDFLMLHWSRLVLRRSLGWPTRPGQLPAPELAARSQVVRVPKLLSSAEITAVLSLAERLPFARKHASAARETCYLSTDGQFKTTLPQVREKILRVARRVDARRWELLAGCGRTVVPRCVECHRLQPGSDILHPGHCECAAHTARKSSSGEHA